MNKNELLLLVCFMVIIIAVLGVAFYHDRADGLFHIVFCDVGQGDATYMRFPGGEDMIVDGGPNARVLTCVGEHMAFWDRTIEIVLLTHPQYDHFKGLTDIISRNEVELLLAPPVDNKAESYHEFMNIVREKGIPVRNPYEGDQITIRGKSPSDESKMSILWPSDDWAADRMITGADTKELLSKKVLGMTTHHEDLNDFSIVASISYGLFDVLLTGDAESQLLEEIVNSGDILSNDIEVLKTPHHGAKAGINQSIIEYIKPDIAVISVGKNNRYGHPSPEVLELLQRFDIPVKRTDQDGEIEIVTDGKSWQIH